MFRFSAGDLKGLREQMQRVNDDHYGRTVHPDYTGMAFRELMPDYLAGDLKWPSCFAVSTSCKIDPFGRVFANCEHYTNVLGNLREQSFKDIWHDQPAARLRTQALGATCRGCWNDCQLLENLAHEEKLVLDANDRGRARSTDWPALPTHLECSSADDRTGLSGGWSGVISAPDGLGGRPCRYTRRRARAFMKVGGPCLYLDMVCPGDRGAPVPVRISITPLDAQGMSTGEPRFEHELRVVRNRWRTWVVSLPQALIGRTVRIELIAPEVWLTHAGAWPTGLLVSRIGFASAANGVREWVGDKQNLAKRMLGRMVRKRNCSA